MTATNVYVPGVCNIGPAEIRLRRLSGWVGSGIAVAYLVVAFAFGFAAPWRLLVGLPVALAASGFLQAALRFCANFGMRGLFNVGELGAQEEVYQREYRRKDQRKAVLILGLSALIAGVVALAAFLIPLP